MEHSTLHNLIVDEMKREIEAYLISEDLEEGKALTADEAEAFLKKNKERIEGFASEMIREYEAEGELDDLQTERERDWLWEFFPEEFIAELDAARSQTEPSTEAHTTDILYQAAANGAMVLPPKHQEAFFNSMTAWMLEHMVGSCQNAEGVWVDNKQQKESILKAHETWVGEPYEVDEE